MRPSERPAESAYYATLQVEGAAALRYPVPGSAGASGTHITNVEVAWENLLEGRRGRATIPDAGPQLPGDFVKTTGPARRAQADLLSIASGGIFARVHRQPEHDQVTYYLDGKQISLHSAGLRLVSFGLLELLKDVDYAAIGGMSIGADPIVGGVLTAAGELDRKLDGFLVRKEAKGHGTNRYVEGPVQPGSRVVVIDDVVTTGGSALLAVDPAS